MSNNLPHQVVIDTIKREISLYSSPLGNDANIYTASVLISAIRDMDLDDPGICSEVYIALDNMFKSKMLNGRILENVKKTMDHLHQQMSPSHNIASQGSQLPA